MIWCAIDNAHALKSEGYLIDSQATSMSKPRVLLTNPIHPRHQARLAEHTEIMLAPDVQPATIAKLIADCEAVMVRSHLAPDVFDHAPRLRFAVRHGVGLDMIPLEAATARGIAVANLPGVNTEAVVEYALAALFDLRRGLARIDQVLRSQGWAAAKPMSNDSVELSGSTLGIIGVGSIGRRLAEVARVLGMRVLGLTRRPETLPAGVAAVDLAGLLRSSDIIVLACPHTPQTHHMIDAQALALVKPTALLINVARGPVVDTPALVQALQQGRLSGAALDVHEPAILSGGEAIFGCPRTLLTPHLAGITANSLEQLSRGAVDTLLALFDGQKPDNVVNPSVFLKGGLK